MADANNAYTLDDADRLAALDDLDLMMIEQPLAWDDIVRHAELQRRCARRSASTSRSPRSSARRTWWRSAPGASSTSSRDAWAASRSRSPSTTTASRHGIPVWCGGMLESGIGRAYNVALASLPNFRLPGRPFAERALLGAGHRHPEWTMDARGMVRVPLDGRASASRWTARASRPSPCARRSCARMTMHRNDHAALPERVASSSRRPSAHSCSSCVARCIARPSSRGRSADAGALRAALGACGIADVRELAGTGLVARIPGDHARGRTDGRRARRHRRAADHRGHGPAVRLAVFAGVMHACGHDMHATWAVGSGMLLVAIPSG
jgi:hypothetical protein